jgi:hypothetical protein
MTARDSGDRAERSPVAEVGRSRRPPPECDLYIPGHGVHWIQARLSWEHPREWGVLEEVREQVVTVRFSDRFARYRNHEVEALLDVAPPGTSVLVSVRYGTLGVPSDHGSLWCFCIADAAEPWRECSVAPHGPVSIDDLVERMEDRGGFSIAGTLLQEIHGPGTEADGHS